MRVALAVAVGVLIAGVVALLPSSLPGGLAASPARADGDPASDVLLGENVFYPYSPPVPTDIQKALNSETAAAAKGGFPIKVALIGSPVDLGVIPDLFGQPQKYAAFLDQEISFHGKQPLLVVMASGYGVQGVPPSVSSAAAYLARPAGGSSSDLARSAIVAVRRLAQAAGHPISGAGATGASSSGSSASTIVLITVLALAALATAAALVLVRRRQSTAR